MTKQPAMLELIRTNLHSPEKAFTLLYRAMEELAQGRSLRLAGKGECAAYEDRGEKTLMRSLIAFRIAQNGAFDSEYAHDDLMSAWEGSLENCPSKVEEWQDAILLVGGLS